MNNQLNFPVGISDFKKIRENDYYYIDKSGLIKELLKRESAEVTLIIRPRRFGKTMGMSMLPHFFDIRSDNRRLFDGLEIIYDEALCSASHKEADTAYGQSFPCGFLFPQKARLLYTLPLTFS